MRRMMLAAACMLVGTCVVGSASIKEEQIEVGGSSSLKFGKSLAEGGGTFYDVTAIAGYFWKKNIELVAAIQYGKEGDADGNGGLVVGADYLWQSRSQWVPYAGGGLGISFGNGSDAIGLIHGGTRYFVNENLSVNIEAKYGSTLSHIGDGRLEADVGLSYYFDHL